LTSVERVASGGSGQQRASHVFLRHNPTVGLQRPVSECRPYLARALRLPRATVI
jgi:hypothetical protein